MKIRLAALVAALPLACAGMAQAAPAYTYTAEIGYARNDLASNVNANLDTIKIRGGIQSGHFGLEMDAGFGVDEASTSFEGVPFKVKENYEVGIYAVGYWPLAKGLDLFGRVGGVGAQFHETLEGGAHGSNNEHGWAAGGGVRWFPGNGKNGIRVEYTRYGMQDDADNFGATYVHKF